VVDGMSGGVWEEDGGEDTARDRCQEIAQVRTGQEKEGSTSQD